MNEKNIKILVVDDFATMRKVVRNLLKQVGYEDIVEAEDGVMALKALKSQKIDVVVSDWNMPNMSGLELLKAVRADADLAKTPISHGDRRSAAGQRRRGGEGGGQQLHRQTVYRGGSERED
jgi:CheY-like chemotaxis protein